MRARRGRSLARPTRRNGLPSPPASRRPFPSSKKRTPRSRPRFAALIVLVIGSAPLKPAWSFGGVTSLTLWGAVTLNTELHRTPLEIAEGLVHEGAHTLLFGYAVDERLVRNPNSERFASPLRSDPRPMDGVFHATFVCARLHLFYRRLLERRPEGLRGFDPRALERKMAQLASRFDDGARLIADKASLTPLGEKVLRSSVDYMSHDAAA